MSTAPRHYPTVEEYLAFERGSETKHEYHAGEIFAMVRAGEARVLIVTNVVTSLGSQLKGRPCKVYSSDMRLKVAPAGLYTYPDVMVVCGQVRFDDAHRDMLLNPNVVIEVLSRSTEVYDRTTKFEHVRQIESCTDYVLISQDAHRIEHHARQPDGSWRVTEASGPDAVVLLDSIGCEFRLSDVYDKVEIPRDED